MANRYWVGGTGNWAVGGTSKWSATSGGASGATVPGVNDDVFFDSLSGANAVVTLTTSPSVRSISLNPSTNYTLAMGANTITLGGTGAVLSIGTSTTTITGTKNFYITSTGSTAISVATSGASGPPNL